MGSRRRARECALQMLFQLDLSDATLEDVFAQFWNEHATADEVRSFAERVVRGVVARRAELDEAVAASAEHWRVERMAVVDRNVLRMGVYEMLHSPDTPPVVVIDEAIEVAKRFGSEASGSFINGILDAVRRRIEAGNLKPCS